MPNSKRRISVHFSIDKIAPNLITIAGLCFGISALRYALDAKFEIAAALIVFATMMDGLDGRIARYFNSESEFGAQIDSLADIVSFGVAPSVVVYLWSLHEIPYKGVGWAIVLFYIICSAIRLARFNVQSAQKGDSMRANYFTGMPIPAAAWISLLPLISTFELLPGEKFSYWLVSAHLILVGLLMVSRIPTFSAKRVDIEKEKIPLLSILAMLIVAGVVLEPWKVIPFICSVYLGSIPIAVLRHKRKYGSVFN
jgi:CDP-diacylglycerol--serine O-phosphatidyltransferase